ncbi:unnamed protein product, partial [Meganyctiphanes norvegica]
FLKPNINVIIRIGFLDRTRQDPGAVLFAATFDHIIKHEEFDPTTLNNDIALIRLPEDVEYNNIIQPICLGSEQDIPFGSFAHASGWGLLKAGDLEIPNLLHEVQLKVVEDASCKNPQLFICTLTPGKDTCQGDSGGPLMIQKGDKWFQIGIVSHGPLNCGESNNPGYYTRIPTYKPWISSIIRLYQRK